MQFRVTSEDPLSHVCQALVVGCCEDALSDPFFAALDRSVEGCLGRLFAQREFTGKPNRTHLVHTLGKIPAERIVLVGLGRKRELTGERIRQAAGAAVQALRSSRLQSFSTLLHLAGDGGAGFLRATVEGAALGGYTFSLYKSGSDDGDAPGEGVLLFPPEAALVEAEQVIREAQTVCTAVLFARDLVAQPGNVATPAYLAEQATAMAGRYGIACQVLERDDMERNGMEALLAVARGSRQPPKFIVLEYRGAAGQVRPTVLVGKGITFDSGGISLKPRDGMEKMKDDMAGGAAVMGTLMAVAALRLPVNLVGLVPAAENLPGGGAYKPGDVVRSMAGKTIEIVNTDAEGRLILCDALHYAQRFRPAALVDLATLTGACVVALGSLASGLLGNDDGLKRAIKRAAQSCGERVWELPLWEEHGELLKSDIADLKNAGGTEAATSTAGWFLSNFVGKARWAHLDIAGTAWTDKERPYLPKGSTGVGVRLMVEYLKGLP